MKNNNPRTLRRIVTLAVLLPMTLMASVATLGNHSAPSGLPAPYADRCSSGASWPASNPPGPTASSLVLEFLSDADVFASPFYVGGPGSPSNPAVIQVPGCLQVYIHVKDLGINVQFSDMTYWLPATIPAPILAALPAECQERESAFCIEDTKGDGHVEIRDFYLGHGLALAVAKDSNLTISQSPWREAPHAGYPGGFYGSNVTFDQVAWVGVEATTDIEGSRVFLKRSDFHSQASWCIPDHINILPATNIPFIPPAQPPIVPYRDVIDPVDSTIGPVNPGPLAGLLPSDLEALFASRFPAWLGHELDGMVEDNTLVPAEAIERYAYLPAWEDVTPGISFIMFNASKSSDLRSFGSTVGGAFIDIASVDSAVRLAGTDLGCSPWGIVGYRTNLTSVATRFTEVAIPYKLNSSTDIISHIEDHYYNEYLETMASTYSVIENQTLGAPTAILPEEITPILDNPTDEANDTVDRGEVYVDKRWALLNWTIDNINVSIDNFDPVPPPVTYPFFSACDVFDGTHPAIGISNTTLTYLGANFADGFPVHASRFVNDSIQFGGVSNVVALPDNNHVRLGSHVPAGVVTCGGPFNLPDPRREVVDDLPQSQLLDPMPPPTPEVGPLPMPSANILIPTDEVSDGLDAFLPMEERSRSPPTRVLSGCDFPVYCLLNGDGTPRYLPAGMVQVQGVINVPLVEPNLRSVHYLVGQPNVGPAGADIDFDGWTVGFYNLVFDPIPSAGSVLQASLSPGPVLQGFLDEALGSSTSTLHFGLVTPGASTGGFGFETDVPDPASPLGARRSVEYYFGEDSWPIVCNDCRTVHDLVERAAVDWGINTMLTCTTVSFDAAEIRGAIERAATSCGNSGEGTEGTEHHYEDDYLELYLQVKDRASRRMPVNILSGGPAGTGIVMQALSGPLCEYMYPCLSADEVTDRTAEFLYVQTEGANVETSGSASRATDGIHVDASLSQDAESLRFEYRSLEDDGFHIQINADQVDCGTHIAEVNGDQDSRSGATYGYDLVSYVDGKKTDCQPTQQPEAGYLQLRLPPSHATNLDEIDLRVWNVEGPKAMNIHKDDDNNATTWTVDSHQRTPADDDDLEVWILWRSEREAAAWTISGTVEHVPQGVPGQSEAQLVLDTINNAYRRAELNVTEGHLKDLAAGISVNNNTMNVTSSYLQRVSVLLPPEKDPDDDLQSFTYRFTNVTVESPGNDAPSWPALTGLPFVAASMDFNGTTMNVAVDNVEGFKKFEVDYNQYNSTFADQNLAGQPSTAFSNQTEIIVTGTSMQRNHNPYVIDFLLHDPDDEGTRVNVSVEFLEGPAGRSVWHLDGSYVQRTEISAGTYENGTRMDMSLLTHEGDIGEYSGTFGNNTQRVLEFEGRYLDQFVLNRTADYPEAEAGNVTNFYFDTPMDPGTYTQDGFLGFRLFGDTNVTAALVGASGYKRVEGVILQDTEGEGSLSVDGAFESWQTNDLDLTFNISTISNDNPELISLRNMSLRHEAGLLLADVMVLHYKDERGETTQGALDFSAGYVSDWNLTIDANNADVGVLNVTGRFTKDVAFARTTLWSPDDPEKGIDDIQVHYQTPAAGYDGRPGLIHANSTKMGGAKVVLPNLNDEVKFGVNITKPIEAAAPTSKPVIDFNASFEYGTVGTGSKTWNLIIDTVENDVRLRAEGVYLKDVEALVLQDGNDYVRASLGNVSTLAFTKQDKTGYRPDIQIGGGFGLPLGPSGATLGIATETCLKRATFSASSPPGASTTTGLEADVRLYRFIKPFDCTLGIETRHDLVLKFRHLHTAEATITPSGATGGGPAVDFHELNLEYHPGSPGLAEMRIVGPGPNTLPFRITKDYFTFEQAGHKCVNELMYQGKFNFSAIDGTSYGGQEEFIVVREGFLLVLANDLLFIQGVDHPNDTMGTTKALVSNCPPI